MQASEKECLVEPLYDILCLREQSDVAPHQCMIKAQPLKTFLFLCVCCIILSYLMYGAYACAYSELRISLDQTVDLNSVDTPNFICSTMRVLIS